MQPVRPSLLRHLEAILFSSGEPVEFGELLRCVREGIAPTLTSIDVRDALADLTTSYDDDPDRTFSVVHVDGSYHLLTKSEYASSLSALHKQRSGRRLSRAALETLSVIAYKQPVTRADVEAIRGVGSDYAIGKLLERELVAILGRDTGPGRPLLYGTSERFMDYFGLRDLSALPKLRELGAPQEGQAIGVEQK